MTAAMRPAHTLSHIILMLDSLDAGLPVADAALLLAFITSFKFFMLFLSTVYEILQLGVVWIG